MSIFNIIGFLLIAGITISAVASADTVEPGQDKCDKSSHETKYKGAEDCIAAVIGNIDANTPGAWNATAYCESKSNLTKCVTDCFNDTGKFDDKIDSVAGRIIDHTCEFSESPSANKTDFEHLQRSKELLLVKHVDNGTQCLKADKVKSDLNTALKGVSNVDLHTGPLSKIIIDSQSGCEKKTSGDAGQNKKDNAVTESAVGNIPPQDRADHSNHTDTSKGDGKANPSSASGINAALLITVIATCVPGYF